MIVIASFARFVFSSLTSDHNRFFTGSFNASTEIILSPPHFLQNFNSCSVLKKNIFHYPVFCLAAWQTTRVWPKTKQRIWPWKSLANWDIYSCVTWVTFGCTKPSNVPESVTLSARKHQGDRAFGKFAIFQCWNEKLLQNGKPTKRDWHEKLFHFVNGYLIAKYFWAQAKKSYNFFYV